MMARLASIVLVLAFSSSAYANSCDKSLDYILNDLPGDLPQSAQAYQNMFQICLQTLAIDNVRDAYILRDGGIAVVPKKAGLLATAQTLAVFCRKFPRRALRFITRSEARRGLTPGLVVLMSSTGGESCERILGNR
jgi:hypothetical protein